MSMANPEQDVRYSGTVQLHISLYLISGRESATEVVRCSKNITKSNKFDVILTVHHLDLEIKCQLDVTEVFIADLNTFELLMMGIMVPETC